MITLTPSLEDYLETIYIISNYKTVVRVKDIAEARDVKTPSVVSALKTLSEKGLILQESYGYIELTEEGEKFGKKIYKKHKILTKFLHEILGVDINTASEDACEIEHHIDKITLDRIVKFIEFIETCPEGEPEWLENFYHYVETGKRPDECPKKD
jgi:DtxR family Mn-dependent transcriptional regulator